MTYDIEIAGNLDEYLSAWNNIMAQFYWYKESPVFDWNTEEEIDYMKDTFLSESHRYLVSRNSSTSEIVGIMGVHLSTPEAVIQRWEPAVKPKLHRTGIESLLLNQGVELAKENGCSTIRMVLKYPLDGAESGKRVISIYEEIGFRDPDAPSAGLFMSIDEREFNPAIPHGVEYTTREDFTDEEIASLIVACFTSTEEDRRIHMKDAGVTDPDVTLIVVRRQREGAYGDAPSECQHLALVDGNLAGIVGSFIRSDKYQPKVGVLGPVGVLPKYRRMGIASFLVKTAVAKLKEKACRYVAVGTPENNHSAILMYKSCGFTDRTRLVRLRFSF